MGWSLGCLGLKPERPLSVSTSQSHVCSVHDHPSKQGNRVSPTQQGNQAAPFPYKPASSPCAQALVRYSPYPSKQPALLALHELLAPARQFGACSAATSKMGRGAQPSASLLLFSLGLVLLYFTAGSTVRLAEAQKTWCIAKPSASNEILAQNLNYACSQVSCAVIQKGGPCYYPDSLVSRAAVAMNLYYAFSGRHAWNCYFNNSALVVQSDPSYGSCTYY